MNAFCRLYRKFKFCLLSGLVFFFILSLIKNYISKPKLYIKFKTMYWSQTLRFVAFFMYFYQGTQVENNLFSNYQCCYSFPAKQNIFRYRSELFVFCRRQIVLSKCRKSLLTHAAVHYSTRNFNCKLLDIMQYRFSILVFFPLEFWRYLNR